MARGTKKDAGGVAPSEENLEVAERKRLKKLALTKNILSETAASASASAFSPLSPSKTVLRHHGKDIIKKSQRKNRFLFSFPGLFAPIAGGKIGELKDLGTKNPVLYLDFPQGQMKLFGTVVYPKNRYLTLQFSRGGKNVMCEDCFDNMIVFSDAQWIGKKDENPDEAPLEFPKELNEGHAEYEFKGGVGVTSATKLGGNRPGTKIVEQLSPKAELGDDLSDGEKNSKDLTETTPVRHSTRTAGKKFNFAEGSSEDDSIEDEDMLSEEEEMKVGTKLDFSSDCSHDKAQKTVLDIDKEDAAATNQFPLQKQESSTPVTKSKKFLQSTTNKSDGLTHNNHGSLVQATISSLFKNVEDKVCALPESPHIQKGRRNLKKTPSLKASGQKSQHMIGTKQKANKAEGPRKKAKMTDDRKAGEEIIKKNNKFEKENKNPSCFKCISPRI
ncbi:DNA-binding protein RHL1 isoform X2 [Malania oleifera]|uniref:DNA-binding protein RHL1 isoform X2 n=1 Tax=Malania oleifera TaxID=397392 RepID=UPI0025AE4670|nr:DNA-binding protein RHL1 isoform X2 [Malania oleifera]